MASVPPMVVVSDDNSASMTVPHQSLIRANRLTDKLNQLKMRNHSIEDDSEREKVCVIVNTKRPIEGVALLSKLAQSCNVVFAWVNFGHTYWLAMSDSGRSNINTMYIDLYHHMSQIELEESGEDD